MSESKFTTAAGARVADNQNSMTADARGLGMLQDVWWLEKLAHFDREVIPERRVHAKGSGAFETFARDVHQMRSGLVARKLLGLAILTSGYAVLLVHGLQHVSGG
jgi:catalase